MGESKVLKSAEIPLQELNAQAISDAIAEAEAEAAIAEAEAIIAEAERAITMAEEALRFAETEAVLNPPTCRG
ncbi:hypothetical protein H5410_032117 [Solanum commersonii]|uniref:Uncharacterized protein n=1 Tax=Solanum commersonii TaxID=4109 RepID=A0A9J5YJ23_SOLCO|nr:hypothetical protein H5410_032117 [Solanum commersonii]